VNNGIKFLGETDDLMEQCNLLAPDVRAAEGWHEVDEICDELKRSHSDLRSLHFARKKVGLLFFNVTWYFVILFHTFLYLLLLYHGITH
jgi:hypothetical protein|tara:strand:- start:139 stop:405 length:267 start_codon:yes stop_codon:yes gene_type:complete